MSLTTASSTLTTVTNNKLHDDTKDNETGEVSMQSLLTIPKTRCFTIQNGANVPLGNGDLQCLVMDDDSLLMYVPGIFNYAINKTFPSLKAGPYSFVFPGIDHTCFGVVFPADTKPEDLAMFEGLLKQHSQFQVQENVNETKSDDSIIPDIKLDISDEDIEKTGKAISSGIKKGTALASKSIQKGTEIAAKGIKKAKDYMKSQIKIREDKHIDPKTIERIQKAKTASQVVVKVSKAIVVGAYSACNELAINLADAASKTTFGQSIINDKSAKMEVAKDIAKNTITGAFVIYEELQMAAIILVGEIADASADVIEYRYGQQMGVAAKHTADIVKDTSNIVKNVTDVGVTTLTANIVGTTIVDTIATDTEKAQMKKIQDSIIENNISNATMIAMVTTTIETNNNLTKKDDKN